MAPLAAQALALLLLAAAMVTALAALSARSLMAMSLQLGASGALGAAVIALLGEGGVAVALVFAVLAPLFLLAAMLLTAPTVRSGARKSWATWAAAAVLATTLIAALVDLGPRAPHEPASGFDGASFWIAPLIFVAAAVSVALLGFGERGALRGSGR